MGTRNFELDNKASRQIIGIPMGFDLPSFSINRFLFYYDSKWMKKVKKVTLGKQ